MANEDQEPNDFSMLDETMPTIARASNGETPDNFDPHQQNNIRLRIDPSFNGKNVSGQLVSSLAPTARTYEAPVTVKLASSQPTQPPQPFQPANRGGQNYAPPFEPSYPDYPYAAPPGYAIPGIQQAPAMQRPAFTPPPPPRSPRVFPTEQPKQLPQPAGLELLWNVPGFGVVPVRVVDAITDDKSMLVLVQLATDNNPTPNTDAAVECALPEKGMLYSLVPTDVSFTHGMYKYTIFGIQHAGPARF